MLQSQLDRKKVEYFLSWFEVSLHQVVKRIGLGVPPTFLAGSDYDSQKAFISVYHRCAFRFNKLMFTIS